MKVTIEQDRQGIAAKVRWQDRSLRMNMQMRLTAVARVPHGAKQDEPANQPLPRNPKPNTPRRRSAENGLSKPIS